MNNIIHTLILFLISILGYSCKTENADTQRPLPIYGEKTIKNGDTILYRIPDFKFIAQDSSPVSNESLSDYIYLTDFFFTSCPSICPIVKKQMLRIYDKYENNPEVKLVSHTLDPKRDTAEKLKQYAEKLNVSGNKWLFLTGDKDSLIDMSAKYFISAYEDEDAPGGIDHSGLVVLVDKKGHIRASAQGTDPDDITELLTDIDKLLMEYETTH